jgi:pimeloyl-ACP methyl ester carboxylesterase
MTQWDERSRYGYWPLSQALASRGIATIEIDTRGTEGYGDNFWSAGNLEAGGKRIEDLIDGIDHLAHEGIVDPKRIAVEGHGLNAVLAFQAAAKYPDRFTALVNFWAPTDLDNYHYMTFIGGRLTKDEVREKFGGETAIRRYLDSLAPLETLNRIHQPTFHHYIRLPTGKLPDDAKKFQRAVAKLGSPHVFHEGTLPVNSFAGYMSTLDQESAAEWTRTTGMLLQFLEHTIVRK